MTATVSSPIPQPGRAAVVASALGAAAYFVVLHALVVSRALPLATLALVVVPWAVAIGSMLLSSQRPPATLRLRRALVLGLACVAALAAWRYASDLAMHADQLLYLENLAFLAGLAALFANSLRGTGDALVTRLARTARNGDMPPAVVAYTRTVTVAWALFFAAAALISTVLFTTQSRTVWSSFANLLLGPLTGMVFVVEYAIRIRLLRDVDHGSLMTGFTTFRQRAQAHERSEPS